MWYFRANEPSAADVVDDENIRTSAEIATDVWESIWNGAKQTLWSRGKGQTVENY